MGLVGFSGAEGMGVACGWDSWGLSGETCGCTRVSIMRGELRVPTGVRRGVGGGAGTCPRAKKESSGEA